MKWHCYGYLFPACKAVLYAGKNKKDFTQHKESSHLTALLLRMRIKQEKERTEGSPAHALSAWGCPPVHLSVWKAHIHCYKMRCACVSYGQAPFRPRSNIDINKRVKSNTVGAGLSLQRGEIARLILWRADKASLTAWRKHSQAR